MTAIAATRRTVKELVDGTLRVTVDVEPMNKAAFLLAFPEVDAPIALAPLKYGGNDEQLDRSPREERARANSMLINPCGCEKGKPHQCEKGGPHSQDAARICKNAEFQKFAEVQERDGYQRFRTGEDGAADFIRWNCDIKSRAELDHNPKALQWFHQLMREFNEWRDKAAKTSFHEWIATKPLLPEDLCQ